jgi:hypothetical protein
MNDPILAEISFSEGRDRCKLRVRGGLRYLRGNSRPYFSITGETYRNGRLDSCGCLHENIEARFPGRFTDLIQIHGSDDFGVPTHAAANGLYWLAGTDPSRNGYGETFHGGSGEFGKTPEECMAIAVDHWRVSRDELEPLRQELSGLWFAAQKDKRREACERFAASLKTRWLDQARAVIASHRLVIFGDAWAEPKAA